MRAAELAYRAIREGILEGRYTPEERLPEETLAAELGVSRTPVREALRRLHGDGFVEFTPNHGARVVAWTRAELHEMFELRALLEGFAASLAARYVTPEQCERLRGLANEMQRHNAVPRPDLERIGELNAEFHDVVLAAARAKLLGSLLANVKLLSLMHKTFHEYSPQQLHRSLAHHQELVSALDGRDPDWAQAVMRSHVLGARNALLRTDSAQVADTDGSDPAQ